MTMKLTRTLLAVLTATLLSAPVFAANDDLVVDTNSAVSAPSAQSGTHHQHHKRHRHRHLH